ncbi:MAG: anion permease [Acidobacteria bacterium]|nr:anion permease [Acidobacteriota bacterium]
MTAPALGRSALPGILGGLAAVAGGLLLPPPAPITEVGMARLGLLAFAVIWWVATPLPAAFTTLAMLAAGVLSGALSLAGAFAHSNSWLLWFVIGTFGLGAALDATGVNRRFALALLDVRWVRGHPVRFMTMFLISATLMSGVMANTVVAVVWLSLAVKIYELLKIDHADPLVEANTLGIAWAANIGGLITPVGNGTNAPTIGLVAAATGTTVTFLQWTAIGSGLALLLMASAIALLWLAVPHGSGTLGGPHLSDHISAERRRLGPMPVAERRALAWVGVAVALWFAPDAARMLLSPDIAAIAQSRLHLTVPALLVPLGMCLTPVPDPKRRFVLTWEEWLRGVDWSLVLFIGGVMALGIAVGEEATGVPGYVRNTLEPLLGHLPETMFVLILCGAVILVTSVISNMVTLAIFVPLGLTLSSSLGVGDPAALGIILGMGTSLAHLLPSGTTTNAIVAGSGFLRVRTMVRHGALLFLLHTLLLALVGYPLAKLVLGH